MKYVRDGLARLALLLFCWPAVAAAADGADPTPPKVLVASFHADWCGKCTELEPEIKRLAGEHASDPVLFVKFDLTDEATRRQAGYLAAELGLSEVWRQHAAGTGFAVVADAKSGVALGRLTTAQTPEQRDATLHDALARAGAAAPASADAVQPVEVGQFAPSATMQSPAGETLAMDNLYTQGPSAVVFYRGGWCPYCNTQLGELAKIETKLKAIGFQILAISPDRPEALAATRDKQGLGYQLLSDNDAELARAYGLAFEVDPATREKYRGYGIDLAAASGHDHHLLPVPAVYLVDRDGMIRYAFWDADYKVRLSSDALLAAARTMQAD
jgi:peroxiredoxin